MLLVLAYLRTCETCTDLATRFGIGVTTVFRSFREAMEMLAALVSPLSTAVEVARRKAFAISDGTCCASTGSA